MSRGARARLLANTMQACQKVMKSMYSIMTVFNTTEFKCRSAIKWSDSKAGYIAPVVKNYSDRYIYVYQFY